MATLFELIPWLAITVGVCLLFMFTVPLFGMLFGNVSMKEELSHKDNFPAGLSVAGALFSLGIVVSGAAAGDFGVSMMHELKLVLSYGALGVILIFTSRVLFDRLSLPKFSVHDAIMKENMAAGIADMGNMIASSIVIYNVMVWVDSVEYKHMVVVVSAWAISQAILFLATLYRNALQKMNVQGKCIQEQIADGNVAVALRFTGYRFSIALALIATSYVVPFEPEELTDVLIDWTIYGLFFAVCATVIGMLMRKVILWGVDVWDEVENQRNVGIAAVQASLFVVSAMLLIGLVR